MIQKLTGMVLHKQPYDDNSAIITILSQELGKLAFFDSITKVEVL